MAERTIRVFGHIVRKTTDGVKIDAEEDGRQAAKGQTCNELVTGFERMDQAGHRLLHHNWGNMAKNHQGHSSADITT